MSLTSRAQKRNSDVVNVAMDIMDEIKSNEPKVDHDLKILTSYYEKRVEDDPFSRVIDATNQFISGDLKFGTCVPDEYRIIVYALAKYKMEQIGKQIIR